MTAGTAPLEDTAISQPSAPEPLQINGDGDHSPPHGQDGPGSPTHSRQTGSYLFGAFKCPRRLTAFAPFCGPAAGEIRSAASAESPMGLCMCCCTGCIEEMASALAPSGECTTVCERWALADYRNLDACDGFTQNATDQSCNSSYSRSVRGVPRSACEC